MQYWSISLMYLRFLLWSNKDREMMEREMKDRRTQKGVWYNIRMAHEFKLFIDFDCWLGFSWSSLIKKILSLRLAQGCKAHDGSALCVVSAISTGGPSGGTHGTVCCSAHYVDLLRISLLTWLLRFFKMIY